ncbi:hypothetical protein WA158_001058 [Blastocystis sp. Blastoise]
MSSIDVSETISKQFSEIQDGSVRCMQAVLDGDNFVVGKLIPNNGNPEQEFSEIVKLAQGGPSFFFFYAKDIPNCDQNWIFISYVPESLNIKVKFAYSTYKNSLRQKLGAGIFTENYHVTDINDMTYSSLLDKICIDLKKEDLYTEFEREEQKAFDINKVVLGQFALVPFTFTDTLREQLNTFFENSLHKCIKIQVENEQYVQKDVFEYTTIEDLIGYLKPESVAPAFYLTNWGDDIKFLYISMDGTPIRVRTLYTTAFSTFVNYVKETSNKQDLKIVQITTDDDLISLYNSIITPSSSVTPSEESPITPSDEQFSRPTPAGRRGNRKPIRKF